MTTRRGFVTSLLGGSVLATAPPLGLSPLLDGTFQWENYLAEGLNKHFICRTMAISDGNEKIDDAELNWLQVQRKSPFDGGILLKKENVTVALYGRQAFNYPTLHVNTKLPDLVPVGNEEGLHYIFGFENGSSAYNGIAAFYLSTMPEYRNRLFALVGPLDGLLQVNIDQSKPADYLTAFHSYVIKIARNIVLFTVDGKPVCLAVIGSSASKIRENAAPYSVVSIPSFPNALSSLFEVSASRSVPAPRDVMYPPSPYRFRVASGADVPPMILPLYVADSGTKFSGLEVTGGRLTSHAFPIQGFKNRTILFQANESGMLSIEVYTHGGNWLAYDARNITANQLCAYPFLINALLARVVFVPSFYPCRISDGEVVFD